MFVSNKATGARLKAVCAGILLVAGAATASAVPATANVINDLSKTFACNLGGACLTGANTANGNGVLGTSKGTGTGVVGESLGGGIGVFGASNGNVAATAVYADDVSPNGLGVYSVTASGTAGKFFNGLNDMNPVLIAQGGVSAGTVPLLETADSNGKVLMAVYDQGNVGITGLLYTGGQCSFGCSKTRHEVTYAAQAAEPVTEDTGEAQLIAGSAYVKLDAAFSNATDHARGYIVTLTPEGDSRGLYVAQRTPHGFTVRETQQGRSNVAFAYRITAHPYGVAAARLPMTDFGTVASGAPSRGHANAFAR
jgi:hypothetical protein